MPLTIINNSVGHTLYCRCTPHAVNSWIHKRLTCREGNAHYNMYTLVNLLLYSGLMYYTLVLCKLINEKLLHI